MISPTNGDGSLSGPGPNGGMGEWIELYNPDLCESVDISCYFLGNYTYEGAGGFRIPDGTIIPPSGFALIRGSSAAPVPANRLIQNGGNVAEIIVPSSITGSGVCCTGTRVWFPNAGGWFAFYDANGVPQDAVKWGPGNQNDVNFGPCIPFRQNCGGVNSLASYAAIPANRKTQVNATDAGTHIGQSIRRIPDGGVWANIGPPTYADCNANCIPPGLSTCDGTATANPVGGTAPYTYLWNDPSFQTTQTAVDLCAGNYTVTVTDAAGNTTQATVTIEDFVPEVTLDISNSYCLNDPIDLLTNYSPSPGAGASGFLTGPGMSGFNFNPMNAGVGTHTLTYTYFDEFDCTNSTTDELVVFDLPQLSVENNLGIYCVTEQTTAFTYTPMGGVLSGPATSGNQFNPSQAGVGNYSLTYTYTDGNGCTNTIPIDLEVVGIPSLSINVPSTICVNEPEFELIGTPSGGNFLVNGNPETVINPAVLGIGQHTIFYELFDQFGCYNNMETTLEVIGLPLIGFNPEYSEACPPLTVSFSAETSPVVSCLWDFGDGNISTQCGAVSHTYTQSGCYDVTITVVDAAGCSSSETAENIVCIYPVPDANFAFSPNPVSEFFTDVQFHNLTTQGDYYIWTIEGGFPSSSNDIHPATTYPPETPGEYPVELIAVTDLGCSDTARAVVIVYPDVLIYIPNTFTPDGNKFNNFWKPSILGISDVGYNLLVFNRWGELMWESTDLNESWDGTYNGVLVKEGTYVWKLEAIQRHTEEIMYWNGHVNVLY
jgi:gliding motility-associated-like protein